MRTVYIGIGSNLNNREENCKNAIKRLIKNGIKVIKLSSAYETKPMGVQEQPNFINMVIKIIAGPTLKPPSSSVAPEAAYDNAGKVNSNKEKYNFFMIF